MPMHKGALESRCTIIRFMAKAGGTITGVKADDLARQVGVPYESWKRHIARLESFGILEVTRTTDWQTGRVPNEYRLLRTEKWFRDHADELDRALHKRAGAAAKVIRDAEEERVLAARSARSARGVVAAEGSQRVRKGLPGVAPPEGEPEPKSKPVSDALREALIEEGMQLPAAELAKWGAGGIL